MVLAMAAFAVEDMFIKAAASKLPIGFILLIFGLVGMLIFMLLTRKRGEAIFHPAILSRPILVRAGCEIIGRLCFALAITLTTLSSASAILQATPLLVILGAAFFFGERIGWLRWLPIIVGFIGVIMIIQPGLDSFESASLFAVISVLGFAGRDIATRAATPILSNMQLGIYGFLILIPTGLVMLVYNHQPIQLNLLSSLQVLGATIFGIFAYYALTVAMRTGEVSIVSPFRYTRLLFALILGIVIFAERPNFVTLVGSLLIVISGSYTLMQSHKVKTMK